MNLKRNDKKLMIFHEGRKRRIKVGEVSYIEKKKCYELCYEEKYTEMKQAIPLGPELTLFKLRHLSPQESLFPSLLDRIPSRDNPAYEDYCHSAGISPTEKNPLTLLGSIGKRGASSFIFEPVYEIPDVAGKDLRDYRKILGMTQHEFAAAFDFPEITINRLENSLSHDPSSLARIKILIAFPEVALWQLKQTGSRIHSRVLSTARDILAKKNG